MRWHRHLICETGSETFNRALGRQIVWITRDGHRVINRADKRCHRPACLEGVTMTAKWFKNFKANMARANADMFGISHAKIKMARLGSVSG